MKFNELRASTWVKLWDSVRPEIDKTETLEEAAQLFIGMLYKEFEDESALARVFVSVPYVALPEFNRSFVNGLADKLGITTQLADNTPVLSLLGTCGKEAAWNDPKQSEGHVGIPLVSAQFAGGIPMVSRLLNQLGLGLEWLDNPEQMSIHTNMTIDGTFFVEDAATGKDSQDRHIIPGREFVRRHGVKTVFGLGGRYLAGNKNLISAIFFTKSSLQAESVQHLLPIIKSFKAATTRFIRNKTIFKE